MFETQKADVYKRNSASTVNYTTVKVKVTVLYVTVKTLIKLKRIYIPGPILSH